MDRERRLLDRQRSEDGLVVKGAVKATGAQVQPSAKFLSTRAFKLIDYLTSSPN